MSHFGEKKILVKMELECKHSFTTFFHDFDNITEMRHFW